MLEHSNYNTKQDPTPVSGGPSRIPVSYCNIRLFGKGRCRVTTLSSENKGRIGPVTKENNAFIIEP